MTSGARHAMSMPRFVLRALPDRRASSPARPVASARRCSAPGPLLAKPRRWMHALRPSTRLDLITLLFRYRTVLLVALHLVLVVASYLLAFVLRLMDDAVIPSWAIGAFIDTLPWVVLFRLLAFGY